MKKHKRKYLHNKWLLALVIVLVAAAVVAILELTNTTHFFHHDNPPAATGPETKGEINNTSDKSVQDTQSNNSSTNNKNQSSPSNGSTSTLPLTTPLGNFVSDHHPNLSGNPAPNQMASSCTTTVGANCQITFTMGSTTKSLTAKTTDAQGSVYWSWTLQNVGLTEGSWTVEAIATLNGNTKTATDAESLVVSP